MEKGGCQWLIRERLFSSSIVRHELLFMLNMEDCIALPKLIDPPIDKSIGIQYHLDMMNTSCRYDVFCRDQRRGRQPIFIAEGDPQYEDSLIWVDVYSAL